MDFVHCLKIKNNNNRVHKTPFWGQEQQTHTLQLIMLFFTAVDKKYGTFIFPNTDLKGTVIFIRVSSTDVNPVSPQSWTGTVRLHIDKPFSTNYFVYTNNDHTFSRLCISGVPYNSHAIKRT
jgi:hypothetical protein